MAPKLKKKVRVCKFDLGGVMLSTEIVLVCVAAMIGAALQEIMHAYALYRSGDARKVRALFRSRFYINLVMLYIFFTPAFSFFWFQDLFSQDVYPFKEALVLGAAGPLLLKKAMSAKSVRLGQENEHSIYWR